MVTFGGKSVPITRRMCRCKLHIEASPNPSSTRLIDRSCSAAATRAVDVESKRMNMTFSSAGSCTGCAQEL